MADQTNRTVWWTCDRCNAQVAVSALVFMPLGDPIINHRRFYFKSLQGEVWQTALLVSGDGLAMEKPMYCLYCGTKLEEDE